MSNEKMIPRGTLFEFWAELKHSKLLPADRKTRKIAIKAIEATDGFIVNGKKPDGTTFSGYLNPNDEGSHEGNLEFIAKEVGVQFEKASRDLIWKIYEPRLGGELSENEEDRLAFIAGLLGKFGALQDAIEEMENEKDDEENDDDDNITPITEA
ncbi:MAG: hypothetical protein U9Q07_04770 [Planctomycetota bacterium]|nr:hypothetical protein [Planctomycetota bacterium]